MEQLLHHEWDVWRRGYEPPCIDRKQNMMLNADDGNPDFSVSAFHRLPPVYTGNSRCVFFVFHPFNTKG